MTTLAPVRPGSAEWALTGLCALLGLASVGSLLAWVFGLGGFAAWFWWFSAPGVTLLGGVAWFVARRPGYCRLHAALAVGSVGGLVGTLGYDLVRVPFALAGLRVLAPIDSYGVLLLGARSSSPWTGLAGWLFHFANGVGFGVAYAAVALGRRWWWGLLWAMVLETATVVTPFSGTYGLSGKWGLIGIAYGAHVAYGVPLGRLVEHPAETLDRLRELAPRGVPLMALCATALVLFVWQHPYRTPARVRAGTAVAPGASALIRHGTLSPQWLRVPVGGCAVLRNDDDRGYPLRLARGHPTLPGRSTARACFDDEGIHRLRTTGRAYSGGFVIVDGEMAG